MLRPILVASALAQCWADCSPGTCQSLEPYFSCDFGGRSNAGGGNTISYADCKGVQIVVRTSLALPSRIVQPKDENIFVFKVPDVMKRLNVFQNNITNIEERFVAKALLIAFQSRLIAFQSPRQFRRLIPKSEVVLEQMWGEVAKWKADLVFGVASPAASCEFCLRMPVQVYGMNSAYNSQTGVDAAADGGARFSHKTGHAGAARKPPIAGPAGIPDWLCARPHCICKCQPLARLSPWQSADATRGRPIPLLLAWFRWCFVWNSPESRGTTGIREKDAGYHRWNGQDDFYVGFTSKHHWTHNRGHWHGDIEETTGRI